MVDHHRRAEDKEGYPDAIDAAVERSVKKVFAIFGVNIDEPHEIEEFREDLRFGKRLRKMTNHAWLAFFLAIASGIGASIWHFFSAAFKGGH